jgi:sulfite reductase alpha subunit-like flavoprotein
MTPEQRFDRLERIVKLMIKAGLRARTQSREQNEKITILIDAQVKNEHRFAALAAAQTRLAESHTRLADSQTHTDQRLDALIDIIREGRNGKSSS